MPVPESEVAMRKSQKDGVQDYLDAYGNSSGHVEPGWLGQLRETSIATFAAAGIPGTREEEWKYTNLACLKNKSYQSPEGEVPEGSFYKTVFRLCHSFRE